MGQLFNICMNYSAPIAMKEGKKKEKRNQIHLTNLHQEGAIKRYNQDKTLCEDVKCKE